MGHGVKMIPNTSIMNITGKSAFDIRVASYHSKDKIEGNDAIELFTPGYTNEVALCLETLTTSTCLTFRNTEGIVEASSSIQAYTEYGNHVDVYKFNYNTGFVKYSVDNSAGLRQIQYARMFRVDWKNRKITWGSAINICPAAGAGTRTHVSLLAGINCGIVPVDFMYVRIIEDLTVYPNEDDSYRRKRTYHYNNLYFNLTTLAISFTNSSGTPTLTGCGDTAANDINIESELYDLTGSWGSGKEYSLIDNWNLYLEKLFAYIVKRTFDATNGNYTWELFFLYGRTVGIQTFKHTAQPIGGPVPVIKGFVTNGQVLDNRGQLLDINLLNGMIVESVYSNFY